MSQFFFLSCSNTAYFPCHRLHTFVTRIKTAFTTCLLPTRHQPMHVWSTSWSGEGTSREHNILSATTDSHIWLIWCSAERSRPVYGCVPHSICVRALNLICTRAHSGCAASVIPNRIFIFFHIHTTNQLNVYSAHDSKCCVFLNWMANLKPGNAYVVARITLF